MSIKNNATRVKLTQKRLKELLSYDKESGLFFWETRTSNRIKKGDIAGWLTEDGYRAVRLDGVSYRAHDLSYLYTNGELPVLPLENINKIKDDNRIENIREVDMIARKKKAKLKPAAQLRAELKKTYFYNEKTGEFVFMEGARKGDVAGSLAVKRKYIQLRFNGETHYAHRLAWLYMFGYLPTLGIDHINHDGTDNRIENLRLASQSNNMRNMSLPRSNTSGVGGVSYDKVNKKWKSQIGVGGKTINLGRYSSIVDAKTAREQANKRYGFHANHLGGELSWEQVYSEGRDFRQGVIKDDLGLMTVAERKEIEKELLDHKKKLAVDNSQ